MRATACVAAHRYKIGTRRVTSVDTAQRVRLGVHREVWDGLAATDAEGASREIVPAEDPWRGRIADVAARPAAFRGHGSRSGARVRSG